MLSLGISGQCFSPGIETRLTNNKCDFYKLLVVYDMELLLYLWAHMVTDRCIVYNKYCLIFSDKLRKQQKSVFPRLLHVMCVARWLSDDRMPDSQVRIHLLLVRTLGIFVLSTMP